MRGPVEYSRYKKEQARISLGRVDDFEAQRFRRFDESPWGIFWRIVNIVIVVVLFGLVIVGFLVSNPVMALYVPIFFLALAIVVKLLREVFDYWAWRDSIVPVNKEINYDELADSTIGAIDRNYREMHHRIVVVPEEEKRNVENDTHVERDEDNPIPRPPEDEQV